jgi:alpha-tubulin suppressor-like RCC1 family protein
MRSCIPLAIVFLATMNGATLCAADTTVYTWGYSGWGQLGNGSLGSGTGADNYIRVPTAIARTATTVVAESDNCYAITAAGSLYAWGKNLVGQVGDGSNTPKASPVAITSPAGKWLSLSCKTIRPVGIMQPTGSPPANLYMWGMVRQKSFFVTSVTVTNGGTGYRVNDPVTFSGNGSGASAKVATIVDGDPIDGYGSIASITVTAGGSYTAAPTVQFPADRPAVEDLVDPALSYPARNGATGTAVMADSGESFSEVEFSQSVPSPIPFNTGIGDLSEYVVVSGTSHGMLLNVNSSSADYGKLFSFGYNGYGQSGLGHRDFVKATGTIPMPPGGVWKSVACGLHFTVGISTLGNLYTWGMNDHRGQLGQGTVNTNLGNDAADPVTLSPKQIMPGFVWASVACGYDHTLALTASGDLYAWGSNFSGELGIGSNVCASTPTFVSSGWTSIACGDRVSFGFKGAQAYSWGNNRMGQLGNNSDTSENVPKVFTFSGTWISAGGAYAVGW